MKKFNAWLTATKSIEASAFEGMDAEEKAGLFNEYNSFINEEHEKAVKDANKSKEELDSLKDEFAAYKNEIIEGQMKSLNDALRVQGVELKRLKDKEASKASNKSFSGSLKEELTKNIDKLKSLKKDDKGTASSSEFTMEVKAAGTITSANISGGNIPVEDRLEGFNTVASRKVTFLDVLSKRSTSSNIVSWAYQANKDGAAGQTGEGLAKNQIDFDFVVSSESLKKTTAYIKISTEMLDDIDWVQSEIENELMKELLKAVEAQAYGGDGTGNNLRGVKTVATAFAAGTFAATVGNANAVDVLRVAMNQIEIAEQDMASAIFMNPSDLTKLKLDKVTSTDKRYIEALQEIASTKSLDGVPIITTTLVTADDFLIGNFDKALLVTKDGIRMDVGLDADDFTKNLRTILAEWRGLTIVKQNDRTAFVEGDFTTAKAALETL